MDSNLIISYLVDFACNYTYFLKKKLNLSDDVRREFFEELGIEEHKIEENKEEFEENKEEISDSDLTAYDIFQVIKITIEQDRIQDNETENN
jgi:hypothetical protein